MNSRKPLGPTELSYIIRAKIEGVSTLTYAFSNTPGNIARLEKLAAERESVTNPTPPEKPTPA